MSILYTNIKKDNSLEYNSQYTAYKRDELICCFESFIKDAKFQITGWVNKRANPYICNIENDNFRLNINMYLKNISGAGWEDKPWIKRIQVPNLRIEHPEKYISTSRSKTFLILGYYNYDNNPIMVAWNAYEYVMHNTLRSCYVEIDDLVRGYNAGYYKGICSHQKIWVFKEKHFEHFLRDYININSLEVEHE